MGVVHRDVSPQNVLIASNGQVRLTDFGVAKARGQLHAPTQTGEVKGKIAYMAPEQVTTKDIDRRVDVFAAGCVLYEATVGERPFQGGDALATLYQLLEEPIVPPSARATDYPPELEAIVLKAMERDRENRYATAAEFNRALEGWLLTEKAMVTERDVAASLKTAVGGRLADISRAIDNAVTAVESGQRPRDTMSDEPRSTSPSGGGKTLAGAALPESAHPARSPKLAIGLGVAALAAGVAIFFGTRGSTETPPSPTPTPSQAAAVAPPPVATPAPPEPAPAPVVSTSSAPVTSAEEVRTTTTRPRGGVRAPVVVRQPTAAQPAPPPPTQPATAAPPPPRAGELPPVQKKIRTLDPDNPFAPKE
jgi:serine/threonine-protein kinase